MDQLEEAEQHDQLGARPSEATPPRSRIFSRPPRPDLDIGVGSQEDEESSMKDKAQMEELGSGMISEATKVTHGQAS